MKKHFTYARRHERLENLACPTTMCSWRVITVFLLLLLTNIGVKAYVVGEYFVKDHITYRVIDASVASPKLAVYNVKGISGTVTIPGTVFDGKDVNFKVTQIGGGIDNDPMRWDDTVTGVILPNTITTLSNYCFAFSSITSLTLPASVTTVGPLANVVLGRCYKLKEILVEDGNPKFISDDGVLYTKGHEELICVPVNKDLSSTGNCLTINSNTKKIHVDAMGDNPTLQKLVVPASVNDMYMERWPTFAYNPTALKEIDVDANNATYCSIDGVVYSKDKKKLIYYPAGKTDATFKVPNGVTSIPYRYSISWNKNLTSIDLNQVETVGEYAMAACLNLKEIHIPKTLTSIEEGAFTMFWRLEKFVVDPGNPNYSSDVNGVLFNKDKTQLLAYPIAREGEYTLPNTVTQIGKQAFLQAKITQLTIPSRITYIGYEAFRGTKIKTLTFEEPSHITALNNREFLWCYDLKTVTLPKSLVYLGHGFSGCTNLETVNVPDGSQLKAILSNAFVNCGNLTNFNFLGSCNLQTIQTNAFADMTKLKEFNFPASVTAIGANAFGNTPAMETVTFDDNSTVISFGQGAFSNSGIKSIKIPASVTSIDKEAFKNCNVLQKVTVPANCTRIDPQAFKFDSKLAEFEVDAGNPKYSSVQGILLSKDKSELIIFPPGKARTDFTLLPPSITKIVDFAFYECGQNFTNVVIPAKVNTIGKRAFGLCRNLKTLTLLCDQVIPSGKIDQGTNTMAFDDGTVASDKATDHVTVYVRRNLLDAYKADPFWSKFTLKPSFTVKAEGTTGSGSTDEYIPTSENTVDLLSTTADVKTFIVPKQVSYKETGAPAAKTYKVGLIGDYAFENANGNMKEVVVKADVDYIGAMAFVTKTQRNVATNTISPVSTTINQIVFTGNTPATQLSRNYFGLGAQFSEFFRGTAGTGACTQKIYVKKSKLADYKSAWPAYTAALDYKIKGDGSTDFKIDHKYQSFAREFDTDFADYRTEKGNTEIAAFAAGSRIIKGQGDYGTSAYHVHMTSIDEHGGNASYGYVPAATGVLLKVLDREKTDADFYYTIGESDDQTYHITDNIMTGITVTDRRVEASPTSPIYVMRDGLFHTTISPVSSFPVHTAYMTTEGLPAGAKLIFDFGNQTTGITSISADEPKGINNDAYYNLNGQRVVGKPQQTGIYIHRGKKIVIK